MQNNEVTATLTYENVDIPISVSISHMLKWEPTHNCNANPKQLIWKFMEELERHGKFI